MGQNPKPVSASLRISPPQLDNSQHIPDAPAFRMSLRPMLGVTQSRSCFDFEAEYTCCALDLSQHSSWIVAKWDAVSSFLSETGDTAELRSRQAVSFHHVLGSFDTF